MRLAPGHRLGPYEIVSPVGAGGMGEVYRAKDTRLDRTVAVKVLPGHVASDVEFRNRFEREARLVSSLDHVNICPLYDFGCEGDIDFLVMPLLEGETLAERLARGPLPPDQAARLAIEIGEALDRAHRQGIVHRDLKPGNIFLVDARRMGTPRPASTPSRVAVDSASVRPGDDQRVSVKLLDFGLARPMRLTGPHHDDGAVATQAPVTSEGTILGTFQYMAPEQLEGRDADVRTDIFAFGTVLFEMLTGRRAFEGPSQASLIGAILKDDPPPVSTVLATVPTSFDYVVSRCLAKDPDDRWQTVRDLLAELKRATTAPAASTVPAVSPQVASAAGRKAGREGIAWLVAGVMTLVAAALFWMLGAEPPAPQVKRLAIPVAPAEVLRGRFALSSDGRQLAFVGRLDGRRSLFVRALDEPQAVKIAGTDGISPTGAVFSPDGKWLAFTADFTLKKVPAGGGTVTELAPSSNAAPTWLGNDTIIFQARAAGHLMRVPAAGGQATPLTTLDAKAGEMQHWWPEALPDGKAIVYCVSTSNLAATMPLLVAQSLIDGTRHPLVAGVSPRFLASGHLVFGRPGTLFAVPFDAATLTVKGDPVVVAENILTDVRTGYAGFSVGGDGSLVYVSGGERPLTQAVLGLVARDGTVRPLPFPTHSYSDPRVSPDGQQIAVHLFEEGRENAVADLRRGTLMRLTFDPAEDETPVWSPDGLFVAYSADRAGDTRAVFRKRADGTGQEEELWTGKGHIHLGSWTGDGKMIVVAAQGQESFDIQTLTIGDKQLKPLFSSRFNETDPSLSPDGRWLAYTSNESGSEEVFVQPFPGLSGRWQISVGGGKQPVWSRDGRELFYRSERHLMAVDVSTTPTFTPGQPKPLFEDNFVSTQGGSHTAYDVMPDGRSFLAVIESAADTSTVTSVPIVLEWFADLKRRLQSAR